MGYNYLIIIIYIHQILNYIYQLTTPKINLYREIHKIRSDNK